MHPRALDPQKLTNWYDLAVIGKSRVAGRPAVIVSSRRVTNRYGLNCIWTVKPLAS
jgi:sigma-E factor negative regulatory protein RseB